MTWSSFPSDAICFALTLADYLLVFIPEGGTRRCRSFGALLKVLDFPVSHQYRLQGCVVIMKLDCSRH